ncbi:mitochondrial import inner membrane translocase subunit Tim10 B isoform X2 [Brienomyrus brachyistius]|uniref:mitochondrial import inner membrane translocase subunit Tim10 B isoform X2 n=1 Tax=Brienomyrus brachyistius TaxID=42636 RepID=UPI0020B2B350|nr:mitochondrial import inner membrane translocase subunit Tim10 B isoform X2 [Brienomyrus brachyistius]
MNHLSSERCVDSCAGKLIRSNHRMMSTYVQLMPRIVQKRLDEMESKVAEVSKGNAGVEPLPAVGPGGASTASTLPGASPTVSPVLAAAQPSATASGGSRAPLAVVQEPTTAPISTVTQGVLPGMVSAGKHQPVPSSSPSNSTTSSASSLGPSDQTGQQILASPLLK